MSNSTNTITIQQTAMSVKSQRQERITKTKQQQEIDENNKDIQMIFSAFDRVRERGITNTKELTWQIMYKENKYENNKNYKNINEQKENQKITTKTKDIQMIFSAFDRVRERGITNTKELTWQIMYKENKYENNKNYKNINEQKENQKITTKTKDIQMIFS
eukprot:119072_1